MRIYVSHASSFDFKTELYEPLERTFGKDYELILPHSTSDGIDTREIIPTCDLVVAETSYPSTGQGIELGWASAGNTPIACFCREGSTPSSALRFISDQQISYTTLDDMLSKLRTLLAQRQA